MGGWGGGGEVATRGGGSEGGRGWRGGETEGGGVVRQRVEGW